MLLAYPDPKSLELKPTGLPKSPGAEFSDPFPDPFRVINHAIWGMYVMNNPAKTEDFELFGDVDIVEVAGSSPVSSTLSRLTEMIYDKRFSGE